MPNIQTIHRQDKTQIIISFIDGTTYELYSLGASLLRWQPKWKSNIVARYQDIDEIQKGGLYLSSTIGPIAGRIAKGQFTLHGNVVRLHDSNRPYLHSGQKGFHTINFDVTTTSIENDHVEVLFSKTTQHDTIPGIMNVRISYLLSQRGIRLTFEVTSNEDTIVNLTNHSYFSLLGKFQNDLYNHQLQIDANNVLLVDQDMIPSKLISVEDTLFDFRTPRSLFPILVDSTWASQTCRGLDHYFFLNSKANAAIRLYSEDSNYNLEITTSYPGVTIYSTNYPTDQLLETNHPIGLHGALAIEPQFPPNGINDSHLYPSILKQGERYHHYIEYEIKEHKKV